MKGTLLQISQDDYILRDGKDVWVGVGNLDVRITTIKDPQNDGIVFEIFPRHNAAGDNLGGGAALYSDAINAGGKSVSAIKGKGGTGNLIKGREDPQDYVMRDEADSAWIGYKEIVIHIKRNDEGVSVDLWPNNTDFANPLDASWVLFSEAEIYDDDAIVNTNTTNPPQHKPVFDKFSVGDRVRVISVDFSADDKGYVGMEGVVFDIQTSGLTVGESEEDPGIWVGFNDETLNTFFWQEELELIGKATAEEVLATCIIDLVVNQERIVLSDH